MPARRLSQRKADIAPIFRYYLEQACSVLNHPLPNLAEPLVKKSDPAALAGNVSELANAAELYAVGIMPMGDTANPLLPSVAPTALDQRVESYERQIITEALNIHRKGELTMSQSICKSRVKLYLRMKKYGLDKHHYRI